MGNIICANFTITHIKISNKLTPSINYFLNQRCFLDPTCTVLYHNKYMKIPIHQHSESVNLFNISKDGAAHIYLDGILYFVVLFNISKDGAAHIYLDGILLYCSIYQKMAQHIYIWMVICILLYCSIYQKMAQHIYIWIVFCCTVQYIKRWRMPLY